MPSTLGIVASHVRPSTFSITPNVVVSSGGKTANWSINTANFGTGTLYYTLSNQTNVVTTADFTDTQVSGPIAITNDIGLLSKTFAVTTETIANFATVLLRTGSVTGNIVAVAPTVTRAVPIYSSSASYHSGTVTHPAYAGGTSFTIPAQPDWDGRWFKIFYNLISNAPLSNLSIMTGSTVTQTLYSYSSPDSSQTVYGRLYSTNSLRINTGYRSFSSTKNYQVSLYPQTNPEIN
jgi:hypothetical protein